MVLLHKLREAIGTGEGIKIAQARARLAEHLADYSDEALHVLAFEDVRLRGESHAKKVYSALSKLNALRDEGRKLRAEDTS